MNRIENIVDVPPEEMDFLLTSTCLKDSPLTLWDYVTGNLIKNYKNVGIVCSKTLANTDEFITGAEEGKPLLHVWPVNSQERLKSGSDLVLPDAANVLAISPDNLYMSVAIGSKLYTWIVCSGQLLTVQEHHLLPITCMDFSSDGILLVTCSRNGQIITYSYSDLIDLPSSYGTDMAQVTPFYIRHDCVMSISDLKVGPFGYQGRFVTVSHDNFGYLYELLTGELLHKINFDNTPSCIAMDQEGLNLYFGSVLGSVYNVNLGNFLENVSKSGSSLSCTHKYYIHSKKVNCLQVSRTGQLLISGSDDLTVRITNLLNGDLLTTIVHKAPVINMKLLVKTSYLFDKTFVPNNLLKCVHKSLLGVEGIISSTRNDKIVFSIEA